MKSNKIFIQFTTIRRPLFYYPKSNNIHIQRTIISFLSNPKPIGKKVNTCTNKREKNTKKGGVKKKGGGDNTLPPTNTGSTQIETKK
jgi:hypothetical protein